MPFFNVDDQFHGHPKRRKAGWAAIGLWTTAGSWCRAYKSDGFVPADLVTEWHAQKNADRLVEVGLWDPAKRDKEDGYQFHDWLDLQSASDEVEKQREKARERQRARRKKLEELRDEA